MADMMQLLRDLRAAVDTITGGTIDGAAVALGVATADLSTAEARERAVSGAMARHGIYGTVYVERVRSALLEVLHGS